MTAPWRHRLGLFAGVLAALCLSIGLALQPVADLSREFLNALPYAALLAAFLLPRHRVAGLGPVWVLLGLSLALLGWVAFLVLWHGNATTLPSRVKFPLLIVPAALILRMWLLPDLTAFRRYVIATTALCAGTALVVALWQGAFPDPMVFEGRAHGRTNPIPFSEVLLTSAGALAIWLYFRAGHRASWPLALACSALLCLTVVGVHVTGTRGTYIALFPLMAGIALGLRFPALPRLPLALLPPLLLALAGLAVEPRTALAVAEIGATIDGAAQGSVGMRFQMWQAAWEQIRTAPVLGHGVRDFRMLIDGQAWPEVANFYHAHNQLIDLWLKAGLPAALLLLAIHLAACRAAWQRPGAPGSEDRAMALCLAWGSLSYLVYGGTQAFFGHSETALSFAFHLGFFAAALGPTRRAEP